MKDTSRWHSPHVEQEVQLVRWGHMGKPVLLFPTAGGDAEEVERFHLIGVLMPLIEAGRIKVYSIDSRGLAQTYIFNTLTLKSLGREPIPK